MPGKTVKVLRLKIFSYALALCLAISNAGSAQSVLSDEDQIWTDRAALLDPNCYEYQYGKNWSQTVPSGETWYLLSAWHILINDSPSVFFIRTFDALNGALALAPGTKLSASAEQAGYIYVCRPSIVATDAKYADPKRLYYKRLALLRSLPIQTIGVEIPAGSGQAATPERLFPTTFNAAFVTSVSSHDVAWSGLKATNGGGMNTADEISDDHQIRFAGPALIPFRREAFPAFYARAASVAGEAAGFSSLKGVAMVTYVSLPNDW